MRQRAGQRGRVADGHEPVRRPQRPARRPRCRPSASARAVWATTRTATTRPAGAGPSSWIASAPASRSSSRASSSTAALTEPRGVGDRAPAPPGPMAGTVPASTPSSWVRRRASASAAGAGAAAGGQPLLVPVERRRPPGAAGRCGSAGRRGSGPGPPAGRSVSRSSSCVDRTCTASGEAQHEQQRRHEHVDPPGADLQGPAQRALERDSRTAASSTSSSAGSGLCVRHGTGAGGWPRRW